MKLLEVLSARPALIVLNCLCLAVVLPMSYALAMFGGLAAYIGRVGRDSTTRSA